MSVSPASATTRVRSDRLVVRLSLASAAILAVVAVVSQFQVAELRRHVAALSFDAAVPVTTAGAGAAAATSLGAHKPHGLIAVSEPTGPAPAPPVQAPPPPPRTLSVEALARLRPTGVDACARMENADAAVLGTLR